MNLVQDLLQTEQQAEAFHSDSDEEKAHGPDVAHHGQDPEMLGGKHNQDMSSIKKRLYIGDTGRLVLKPSKKSVLRWFLLVAMVLAVEVPLLPLRLAFVPEDELPAFPWLFYFSIYADLIMWMDLGLQFFLEVPSADRSYWVNKFSVIWRTYAKNPYGLFPDLFAVLPLRSFGLLLAGPEAQACQSAIGSGLVVRRPGCSAGLFGPCSLSLLSFHKLSRFTRLVRLRKHLQEHVVVARVMSRFKHWHKIMGKSFFLTMLITHVMGCLWAQQARCGNSMGRRTWLDLVAESPGKERATLYRHDNVFGVYLCSLYWSVYTLTGIGYGDVVPVSITEYFLSIVCMFVGSMTWAWVMASLVSIMSTMNQANNENSKLLDCINILMESKTVPAKMSERLREYVVKMRDVKDQDAFAEIMRCLSPELKVRVVYVVHANLIQQVWWLNNIPWRTGLVVDVTEALVANMHTPGELIPNKAQLVQIRSGLCIRGGRLLGKGKVYGEDFILDSPELRQPDLVFVLTFLHTAVLDKADFFRVLTKYPDVERLVRKSFVRLVCIRGIHWAAKMRKRYQDDEKRGVPSESATLHAMKSLFQADFAPQKSAQSRRDGHLEPGFGRGSVVHQVVGQDMQVLEHVAHALPNAVVSAELRLNAKMKVIEDASSQLLEKARQLRQAVPLVSA